MTLSILLLLLLLLYFIIIGSILPLSLCQMQTMLAGSFALASSDKIACVCSHLGGLYLYPQP